MLETRLETRILAKKEQLDGLRLPATAVQKLNEELIVEWIYNSNAIEGSTLSLQETRLILEQGITIGGKSLREHFEVVNHQQAIHFVEALVQEDTPLSPFHVRQIHALVLARIDDQNAGQYRNIPVRIAGSTHEPPPAWKIALLLDDWGKWLAEQEQEMDTITLAAIAQHKLVAIHPFIDGNGRTARLIMNVILMRAGYPPAIIATSNRQQYYHVLSQADRDNPVPIVNFVGRAVERSLTLYVQACTPQMEAPSPQDAWIPLRDATAFVPYSQEYLSLLARTGKLEAIKKGRVWHTTRQALQDYQGSLADT